MLLMRQAGIESWLLTHDRQCSERHTSAGLLHKVDAGRIFP